MNIKEEFEKNKDLVQMKETSDPNLFVLKYRRKVFYAGLWNDFLRECRGLIVDKDFNIVTYPFTKIHNFRVETDAPDLPDETEVYVMRKVNGFMVAMTSYKGKLLVSTTGSIDSDFVDMAWGFVTPLLEQFILKYPNRTFLFECVHENDPHIVPEVPGLYFLGSRENVIGSNIDFVDIIPKVPGVYTLNIEENTVGELMSNLKNVQHEGFVFYTKSEPQIASKVKSPHYLTKKLFMRGNLDKILARDIKKTIDEEYYPLVDFIAENREKFTTLDEMGRRQMIEEFLSCN